MFKSTLMAGLVVACFIPSLVQAQIDRDCQDQKHDNRVVGTIVGAGLGALLGNAIGEHGGKTGGTIIGGVGGAVAGNAIGASTVHCGSNQYGRYDDQGRWVPRTATAYGYYGPDGRWVETQNQGYSTYQSPGYQSQGYQTPGYQTPGYQGPVGQPPRRDTYAPPPVVDGYRGANGAYGNRDPWAGAPQDTRAREVWLEQRIQHQMADGDLDSWRGRHALRQLSDIQRMDADYRAYDGHLNADQRRDIFARLDTVKDSIADRRGAYPPRGY